LRKVRSHIYSGKRVRPGRYEATAYGPPWNALQGSGITSTGIKLGKRFRRYLVAIDPQQNRYGRFVWIWPNPFRWKGPFLTADTGGAIRGKRIDFYDWRGRKKQYRWGRKSVRLYKSPPARFIRSTHSSSGGLRPGCSNTYTFSQYRRWTKRQQRRKKITGAAWKKHRLYIQCAQGPGHRKAMRARWKKVLRSRLPKNHDLWVRIGRCEQPGRGYRGIRWSHPGPTYQGGLGFWYGTWQSFKYPGMPGNAGQATWRQQMKVANRLFRKYGTSPWGCA
jgi:3D (Asp-Asp-Asp) domain-containing protein